MIRIESSEKDGELNFMLHIDRPKSRTVAKEAMAKFLQKMMILKSTADVEGATEMFGNYSKVNEFFLKMRETVIKRKKPRRVDLQGNI